MPEQDRGKANSPSSSVPLSTSPPSEMGSWHRTTWALLAWFLKVQRFSKHRRDHSQHMMGYMRRQPMLSVCTLCLLALSMSKCFNLLGSSDLPRKNHGLHGHLFSWNDRPPQNITEQLWNPLEAHFSFPSSHDLFLFSSRRPKCGVET